MMRWTGEENRCDSQSAFQQHAARSCGLYIPCHKDSSDSTPTLVLSQCMTTDIIYKVIILLKYTLAV